MDKPKRLTIPAQPLDWRRGLLAFYAASVLYQVGCDRFFQMEGFLYQCGTKVPIAGADGTADRQGHVLSRFTTDGRGRFGFRLNDGPGATVRVSFAKEGFVPFSHEFEGLPANSIDMEFCMDPVRQP